MKKIQIISFDLDGTLVDQKFNDIIWEREIPRLYAKKKGIEFIQAKDYVIREYKKIGEKDLRWYDLEYWLQRFKIDVPPLAILKKWRREIKVYPDVLPVLKELKKRKYHLIIITCMPRIFLKEKVSGLDTYFERIFSTISDFQQVKNARVYRKIADLLKVPPSSILHVGDHPQLDYQEAKEAGFQVFLLRRGKKKESPSSLKELLNFL